MGLTKKGKNGQIFHSEYQYVRKIGTDEVYIYSEPLMARGDFQRYDPFAGPGDGRTPRQDPKVDPAEHHKEKFKVEFGIDRDKVRADLKQYKVRAHKMFYALDMLFSLEPVHDLANFKPPYNRVAKIIGPTFTQEDLDIALSVFKQNPNLQFLTSEAANDLITDAQLGVEPSGRHSGAIPVE